MKDYATYTAADFAYDDAFLKWVKYPERYPLLNKFWQDWLKENPHKKEAIEEARTMILAVLHERQYSAEAGKQGEVWKRINMILADSARPAKQVPLWRHAYSKAAVIALWISAGAGLFLWYSRENSTLLSDSTVWEELPLEKQINNSDQPKTIVLSDETSIVLQPHSILQYPRNFDHDIREVYLSGEAFFEVKKDRGRPFLVHAREIVTRVLGTSFTVRSYEEEKNVLVQVKTGKVSVFKQQKNKQDKRAKHLVPDETVEGVVLMPNQQVVCELDEMKMTKSLVENPSMLVPAAQQKFEFADAPIRDVFAAIEQAYGVDIVYDEEALAKCYLHASLTGVPLYDKLKLIGKCINTTYEIMDSHIIIYGKGCE